MGRPGAVGVAPVLEIKQTKITNMKEQIKYSIEELTAQISRYGYTLKKTKDGRLEAYPRYKRGDLSLFKSDDNRQGMLRAVMVAASNTFARRLHTAINQHPRAGSARFALLLWFEAHGVKWEDRLRRAWEDGNYGHAGSERNVEADLQSLRNTCGRALLETLKNQS